MKLERVEVVETESRFRDVKYTLVGAFYGFLAGNAFVISGATVDRLLHPDLPLGIDWSIVAMRWVWIGLGLALIGAITSFFNDKMPGLLAGALVTGFVALTSALFSSPVTTGLKVLVLIFTLAPMAAMSLPVTLILRWLVDKHEDALQLQQHIRRISLLVLLAIVLGAGSGYFLKMSRRAVQATRFMHHQLQTAPQDAESPIHDLPDFQSHVDMNYQLFQGPSESSAEGFDVRAEYNDGYSVNCVVVIYPGSDPYFSDCTSAQK